VLAAQLLTACNSVVSSKPWFNQATDAPQLREGVWRFASDKPCNVDETRPLPTWPDCAFGLVVRGSQLQGYQRDDKGHVQPFAMPYVLAPGDPVIVQLNDTTASSPTFDYAWLTPVRRDDKGRVVEVHGSSVGCGPSNASPSGQPALYPGITAQSGGCVADSVDALRAAAKSSVTDGPPQDVFNAHWLRAGDR
jgi:hypothetical protein